ncbi:hypothetical protein [Halorussus caseinilyticus]|uniref:Uncharacterized protein n=1 Tax=Halorussus caseinilyticus TaxID=3034025 RepID=A0ABD5WNP1_9EURY|nr:hypothetical protein [Halorussus sp. DT72]
MFGADRGFRSVLPTAMLGVHHRLEQRFRYDRARTPKFGAAGTSRQMFNDVSLNRPGGGGGGRGSGGGGN